MRGWGALSMVVRAEVRRRFGTFALAIVLAILAGGGAITAAAGARRSDTAYERFLVWSGRPAFGTGGASGSDEQLAAELRAIEHAPFVDAVAHTPLASLQLHGKDGELLQPFQVAVVGDADGVLANGPVGREKVIRGRHARRDAVDEMTVAFPVADRIGRDVGDHVTLSSPDRKRDFDMKIVGVVARPGEFPNLSGTAYSSVALPPGFVRKYPEYFEPGNDSILVSVRDGVGRPEVEQWLRDHVKVTDIADQAGTTRSITRTIRVETVALATVAGLLALVFLVLVGQVLLRFATGRSDDVSVLSVLGFSLTQVRGLGAARGAVVGGVAAIGAVAAAALASPLTPVGLGRLAEPHPGLHVDVPVLAAGALLIFAACVLLGLVTAGRARAWSSVNARAARAAAPLPPLPAPAFAGLHLLLRPARRRERGVATVTIASLCFVVAMLVAVLTMVGSLAQLQDHPPLVGATWDAAYFPDGTNHQQATPEQFARAVEKLRTAPAVAAVNATGWTKVNVGDQQLNVQVFDDGPIRPAIATGRVPRAGEIALGAEEMDRLHARIGGHLAVAADGKPARELRVVGRSVLVPPVFQSFAPGEGAAISLSTMKELGVPESEAVGGALIRFTPGTNVTRALPVAASAAGPGFFFSSRDRTVVDGVDRVRSVPVALIAILAVLGAIGLAHVLIVSTRRRRGDTAILRAIGFTRAQVVAMVAVYGFGVAAIALIVGVPLGVVTGRVSWNQIALYLRVVPDPHLSPAVLAAVLVAVGCATIATVIPMGRRAARTAPGRILRTETG